MNDIVLVWLTITSEIALFVMGYVLGFVGGKHAAFKDAKANMKTEGLT